MTRCLSWGLCVQACPVGVLAATREYEWAVSDKRDLFLNKEQLLAIGDRTLITRERRLEFQHLNLAVFNIAVSNYPSKSVLVSPSGDLA